MDASIQQNAAFVEQTTAATSGLSSKASEVEGVVGRYCIMALPSR